MRVILALLMLVIVVGNTSPVASAQTGNPMRTRESFNDGWRFARFGAMPDGSTAAEPSKLESEKTADDHWRQLDLPHDWAIEGPFRSDLPSSTGKLPWAGIGWYRKHFRVPTDNGEKKLFVEFDGAMSHAKVWLNGHYLGEWPYGYASFSFELTPFLHRGGKNVLAVRLDNPPNSSRWYPGGGIYRNVWLVTTGPVHFAHWGIRVTTPLVESSHARVLVQTDIDNQSRRDEDVMLSVSVGEPGAGAIGSARGTTVRVHPGKPGTAECAIDAASPHLWSPDHPALYTARTTLSIRGRIVDSSTTVFGIRTVAFSATDGLLVNGKRVRINGVCNHHDLGPLGTAVNARALERQIQLLQEMGCNAIRTSHNPPAPELLDLCDRMGILVLDEAFDCWLTAKTPNDYSTLFAAWHEKDIRAFVRRDRNHPCVFAWSCGNEVQEQSNGDLASKMVALFHAEDSSRVVTAACDNPNAGFDGFQNAVDIFGYNYKPRLYARFHRENPSKPLFGSETASTISSYGEYFFPVSDDKSHGVGIGQVSSYDLSASPWATIPDVEFAGQDSTPSVMGEFVWTGFDYLGEPTPFYDDTCTSRSSYFGIMDLCGFKKDRFFIYQARWKPEFPMAHILPHWNWPERMGNVTPVHVYTSGDEAELFLNGRSLGRKTKSAFQYRVRWDSVMYAPGELKVVAYKGGKVWATDVKQTTGAPSRIDITADRSLLATDGEDLAFLTVRVVDAHGLTVPTANNTVRFTIEGPAQIAAVANGDPTDHDSFRSTSAKSFHGLSLVIVRSVKSTDGVIKVTASSDGLDSTQVELHVNVK